MDYNRLWKKWFDTGIVEMMTALFIIFGLASMVSAAEMVNFQSEIKESLRMPKDMAVGVDERLYVLDQKQSKIFVYDNQGNMELTIGEYGAGPGKLSAPSALAISSYGEIVVADTGNKRVSVFSPDGSYLYHLGNAGNLPGQFMKPTAVAVDPFGYIYVVDSSLNKLSKFSPKGVFFTQQEFDYKPDDIVFDEERFMYVLSKELGQIVKYNLEDGTASVIEYMEDGMNVLTQTESMDVDSRGDIYLMEHAKHRIIKINQDGNKILSFGSQGKARGQFMKPMGILAGKDHQVYVADSKNKRVQVLSVVGSSKYHLVTPMSKPPMVDFEKMIPAEKRIVDLTMNPMLGLYALSQEKGYILKNHHMDQSVLGMTEDYAEKLRDPKSIYVTNDGRLYVTDTGNHRLKFLNSDGSHEYAFGEKGSNNGQFYGLSGVAINYEGFIYVADTQNNRIQVFNGDGIYLYSIGEKSAEVANDGTAPVTFHHPTTLAFDAQGLLYVLDSRNARIQVLTSDGHYVREIGGATHPGLLQQPIDFALDEMNYVYVADRGDHRIKVLDQQGDLIVDFGSRGMGPSYFPQLSAISASQGKIYVADYLVDDIKVFNFDLNRMSNQPQLTYGNTMEVEDASSLMVIEDKDVSEEVMAESVIESEENIDEVVVAPEQEIIEEVVEEMAEVSVEETTEATPMIDPEISLEEAKKIVGHDKMKYKISRDGTKLFATIVSYPIEGIVMAEDIQFNAARKVALDVINQELANKIGVALEAVLEYIQIESEEKMDNGRLKLTVSVPKQILFKKYKEAKMKKKMERRMQNKI